MHELPPEKQPEDDDERRAAEEDRQLREALRLSALEAKQQEARDDRKSVAHQSPTHPSMPSCSTAAAPRRQRRVQELPPEHPEDEEACQLRLAREWSLATARREEEQRKKARDAELTARLVASEQTRRAAVEAEARRIAAEVLERRQQRQQQLDENRRLAAVEAFVARAVVALDERELEGQLRRAALTIGVVAASQLLGQTLALEAAGGMLRNDGSNTRRTPGGVFLSVLLRENISRHEYKHIQAARPQKPPTPPAWWAFVRDVPPQAAEGGSGSLDAALRARGWPRPRASKHRLKLRAGADGRLSGRVYFASREDRADALALGSVEVEGGGGSVAIEERPAAGTSGDGCADASDEPWVLVPAAASAEEPKDDGDGDGDGEEEEEEEWCPDDFICPITLELLQDPVVAADGLTYERAALQDWMGKHAPGTEVLSPATGVPLAHRVLRPNADVLEQIASVGRLARWL